ncbi:MAG: membrane-bound PQQ-dependent dehydrogenase, glucose/quinate/shikimate family, partial [Bradyrhizobium sp.]|nr:membrane-bound PQQ-dependent dehydrogenase, glucose/quinate/shikimate family [Bradyrhizobium sp.]
MAAARDLQRAPLLTFTAVIVGLMGLALLAGGAWLAAIGGSLYYVMAGAALLGTAWLLWQRRAAALWLDAALLLGTMTWAISEV